MIRAPRADRGRTTAEESGTTLLVFRSREARERLEAALERLRDLKDGVAAVAGVVAFGEDAVPALESLLRGPTEPVAQPRCLAVDALGAIRSPAAAGALLRTLEDSSSRPLNPVLRDAEDAVLNRVAENLDRLEDPRIAEALLTALDRRPSAACAAALGRRKDARALPRLIEYLRDDFARDAASVPALAAALAGPEADRGPEGSVGVASRVAAAEALGEIGGADSEKALVEALSDGKDRSARRRRWRFPLSPGTRRASCRRLSRRSGKPISPFARRSSRLSKASALPWKRRS